MTDALITIGNHLVQALQAERNGETTDTRYHIRQIQQLCDAVLEVLDDDE